MQRETERDSRYAEYGVTFASRRTGRRLTFRLPCWVRSEVPPEVHLMGEEGLWRISERWFHFHFWTVSFLLPVSPLTFIHHHHHYHYHYHYHYYHHHHRHRPFFSVLLNETFPVFAYFPSLHNSRKVTGRDFKKRSQKCYFMFRAKLICPQIAGKSYLLNTE